MDVGDGMAERGVAVHDRRRYRDGLIGRVVEQLDVELLARIIHLADGFDEAIDHELFVEDRQLNGDGGQFLGAEEARRLARFGAVLLVLVIKKDQDIAMDAVGGEHNEDEEVGDEQQQIEALAW